MSKTIGLSLKGVNALCWSLFLTLASAYLYVANAAEITKNGNTITISGPIEGSDGNKFKNLFNDSITLVRLESPGGSVAGGLPIADLIYDNRDRVFTEAIGHCESMCSAIWLAADKHVYNADAKIGFHLSYIPDTDYWVEQKEKYGFDGVEHVHKDGVLRDVKSYFAWINDKHTFGRFLNGLHHEGLLGYNMWYPTDSELIAFEGQWSKLPSDSRTYDLFDSDDWLNIHAVSPTADKEYINGQWKTTVTFKLRTYDSKVTAYLLDGTLDKARLLRVKTSKDATIDYSGVYKADPSGDTEYTITLWSTELPRYFWVETSDGTLVYGHVR